MNYIGRAASERVLILPNVLCRAREIFDEYLILSVDTRCTYNIQIAKANKSILIIRSFQFIWRADRETVKISITPVKGLTQWSKQINGERQ